MVMSGEVWLLISQARYLSGVVVRRRGERARAAGRFFVPYTSLTAHGALARGTLRNCAARWACTLYFLKRMGSGGSPYVYLKVLPVPYLQMRGVGNAP